MKKLFRNFCATAIAGLMILSGAACSKDGGGEVDGNNMAKLTYPDFAETPADKDSWEYIPEDTDQTIEWYVDVSSWAIPTENAVLKKIKEKTGISIRFVTPVQDDGQKLSTMIAGGDLPDVISVPTSKTQTLASLAQQGYVYDIDTLQEKWAPSLKDHLPEDVHDWWAYGNNKIYGIPNHYYSYEDIPEGEQLQPNGGMMVREDLFNKWQEIAEKKAGSDGKITYTAIDGTQKSVEWQGYITTPEGFKEAAGKFVAVKDYSPSAATDPKFATKIQLLSIDSEELLTTDIGEGWLGLRTWDNTDTMNGDTMYERLYGGSVVSNAYGHVNGANGYEIICHVCLEKSESEDYLFTQKPISFLYSAN